MLEQPLLRYHVLMEKPGSIRFSLRMRLGLLLLGVVLLYTALDYTVDQVSVMPSFVQLEREEAKEDIARCVKALQREVHHLDLLAWDWASWNDTYEFAAQRNEDYVDSNLVLPTFTDNHLTLLAMFDPQGRLIWGEAHDAIDGRSIPLREFFPAPLPERLRAAPTEDANPLAGFFLTPHGPLLVSFRAILTSEDKGPSRGTFVVGRLLSPDMLAELQEQTGVPFQAVSVAKLSEQQLQLLSAVKQGEGAHIEQASNEVLVVYSEITDIFGNPALLLRSDMPRTLSRKGRDSLRSALFSTLGGGLVAVLILMVVLGWTIITPLSTLTRQVVAITRTDDLSRRVNMSGGDEIGTLAHEFDGLLERLEQDIREREKMNDALRESERLAAIGQMSASVAHEIRNPLTGISSAIQVLDKSIPQDDPRKPIFREIINQVNRADNTIRSLLMFARPWTPEKRPSDVARLVEESCNEVGDQDEFQNIRFVCELPDGLTASLDPGLCRQVLVNLYRNAAHAMPEGGEIRVEAAAQDSTLSITVKDSGQGVSREVQERAFDPFFTTKTRGTGLGLPVCRQIIEAHGGTIDLASKPGQGTEVKIQLPFGV